MSGFEVIGVGAVFWFMQLVLEPDRLSQYAFLDGLKSGLSVHDNTHLLIMMGVVLFLVMLARNCFGAFTLYAQERFVLGRNARLSVRLLKSCMSKPYSAFLMENSADLTKRVIDDVWQISSKIIMPLVDITSKLVVTIAIVGLLLWVDIVMTGVIVFLLLTWSVLLYSLLRSRLHWVGVSLMHADGRRFISLAECIGGLKEIKVLGREPFFQQRFRNAVMQHSRFLMMQRVLSQVSHFALEALAIGALIGVILYTLIWSGDSAAVVSTATLYVVAGYRILPAIKIVVRGLNLIRLSQPFLDSLASDLRRPERALQSDHRAGERLSFEREIEFKNVSFAYDKASSRPAIRDVTMVIKHNSSVAFVGPTGAGKSTLVDLLVGLHVADSGQIRIDGRPLDARNAPMWSANIGYVPQSMYLLDDTIRRNIAFGVSEDEIDDNAVRRAARLASVSEFIDSRLPDGYETVVGDRGNRLSGGERQRIAISRALYGHPSLLVLDEATSAVDGRTETIIGDAIQALRRQITLVIVAHRLSTVRNCDVIYLMEGGRITDSGTYGELLGRNDVFRAMAGQAAG